MKRFLFLVTLLLFSATQVQSAPTWHVFGGHSYALTEVSGGWNAMQAEANSLGGDLVSINSAAEDAFLASTFMAGLPTNTPRWIGLFQNFASPDFSEPAGGWEWVDGTLTTSYSNWWTTANGAGVDNPTNGGGIEHYGSLLHKTGIGDRWNDITETTVLFGIVELNHVIPVPGSFCLVALGVAVASFLLKRSSF